VQLVEDELLRNAKVQRNHANMQEEPSEVFAEKEQIQKSDNTRNQYKKSIQSKFKFAVFFIINIMYYTHNTLYTLNIMYADNLKINSVLLS
jgi:hypothetical protein